MAKAEHGGAASGGAWSSNGVARTVAPVMLSLGEGAREQPASSGEAFELVYSVVPSWNRRDLTLRCVRSLLRLAVPPGTEHRVLLVDDGSRDGTGEAVRRLWPHVEVLRLERNGGFAAAANAGVELAVGAGAAWALLVNNDTEAPPDLLAALLGADVSGEPDVGIVVPTINRFDEPERIWPSAGTRRRWTLAAVDTTANPPSRAPYEVDWAVGCCMLIKAGLWRKLGGFDPVYRMYYEDHDMCIRARAAGWRIAHVPGARLAHHVAGSSGDGTPAQVYMLARSSVPYFWRHSRGLHRGFIVAYRLGSHTRRLAAALLAGRGDVARAQLAGVRDGIRDLRATPDRPREEPISPAQGATATSGPGGPVELGPSVPTPGRADILRWLEGVRIAQDDIDGEKLIAARADIEHYAWLHGRSAELALAMIGRHLPPAQARREVPLRVLEIGGAPYCFSALMHAVFGAELTVVSVEAGSWPGEAARTPMGRVSLTVPSAAVSARSGNGRLASAGSAGTTAFGGGTSLELEVRVLNVEKDPFPFSDDSFDVVLCMEVLEHLGYSPSHMLAESHRVLSPGGLLFMTVPNFINIKRLVNMFFNRPTEFPYSGYGIYGRHQREFAPFEVDELLRACNYSVEELATANVWPTFRGNRAKGLGNAALNALTALPLPWLAAKREFILCAAHPVREPLAAYPAWLYEHRHMYPEPPNGIRAARD